MDCKCKDCKCKCKYINVIVDVKIVIVLNYVIALAAIVSKDKLKYWILITYSKLLTILSLNLFL